MLLDSQDKLEQDIEFNTVVELRKYPEVSEVVIDAYTALDAPYNPDRSVATSIVVNKNKDLYTIPGDTVQLVINQPRSVKRVVLPVLHLRSAAGMFAGIDTGTLNIDHLDFSKCVDYYWMFNGANTPEVVMPECTPKVRFDMDKMFKDSRIDRIDFSRFDMSLVNNMHSMFNNNHTLKTLSFDKNARYELNKVSVSCMFYNSNIAELDLSMFHIHISNADVCHYENLTSHVFDGCTELRSLDISGFHAPPGGEQMCWYKLLYNCNKLKHVRISRDLHEYLCLGGCRYINLPRHIGAEGVNWEGWEIV